ncbi:MAG: Holliday junction branch migration protein RuvA [Clostridia bacterium]|nr:Holliday junction branch migration protein RuvA [Clostridia bacterium]
MLYSIEGKLIHKQSDFSVIQSAGIGYRCFISNQTAADLPAVGQAAKLYTHLVIREDSLTLFGFSKLSELNCFKLLTSVSGVGAKVALALLSTLLAEQIAAAAVTDDYKTLMLAPGVGAKTAKRIILELKDKLKNLNLPSKENLRKLPVQDNSSNALKALGALEVLGFSKNDIVPVLNNLDSNLSVEQLIRLSLKELSGGV